MGVGEFFVLVRKAMIKEVSNDEVLNFIDKNLGPKRKSMTDSLEKLMKFQGEESNIRSKMASETYAFTKILSLIISAVGLIIAFSVGVYFSGMISKTISKICGDVLNSSEQTLAASGQLTSASNQLSQGASESAASLEETVSSLEELSSMVKLNADHAKEANMLSQNSFLSAEKGEIEITKLIQAMSEMAKSSRKIEEIINVIDDIAFQTNLLALNAAVEAARAGDQGKGFAVVADAVRSLAQRSAVAAKDINILIKDNVEKMAEGSKIADSSGNSLKEIVSSVKKVASLNNEISVASQEQANGIEQISKAMNHLDHAVQSNAASSEEVASSAEEMSAQADCLVNLVGDLQIFVLGHTSKISNQMNEIVNFEMNDNVHMMKKSQKHEVDFSLDQGKDEDSIKDASGF